MFAYLNASVPEAFLTPTYRGDALRTREAYNILSRVQQAEYIEGLVLPTLLTGEVHNRVRLRVAQLLDQLVGTEARVSVGWAWHDGCNVFIPDVMVYDTDDTGDEWYTGTPRLVVEVLEAQASVDWMLKTSKYAQAGVLQYWIVDPVRETLDVLHLDDDRYLPPTTFGSGRRGLLGANDEEVERLISHLFT